MEGTFFASLALPEVVIITLAHRGDRRIDPLVAGPSALAAMQKSGFDKLSCQLYLTKGGNMETPGPKRQALYHTTSVVLEFARL